VNCVISKQLADHSHAESVDDALESYREDFCENILVDLAEGGSIQLGWEVIHEMIFDDESMISVIDDAYSRAMKAANEKDPDEALLACTQIAALVKAVTVSHIATVDIEAIMAADEE